MKAIILAAGKGTRLRPLTYGIPKPLLPVKGKAMIEWVMNSIHHEDIDEVIVGVSGTVGDNPEERILSHVQGINIDSFLRNLETPFKIRTIPTPMRETGGDLKFVLEEAGIRKGTVIVAYGDNLTSFNMKEMLDYHYKCRREHGTSATILLFEAPESDLHRFGIAKLKQINDLNLIEYFIEKPKLEHAPSRYANGGYYIIEVEDVLDKLPTDKIKTEQSLFPQLAAAGKLAGFTTKLPYWIDISTIESYNQANQMAHEGLILPPAPKNGNSNGDNNES